MMLSNAALLIFQVYLIIAGNCFVLGVYITASLHYIQVIGMCHIFSNTNPSNAKVMVWVLAGLSTLAG